MILNQIITHYREYKGLSRVEFAKAIGISQSSLSRIENNKAKVTSDTFEKFISVFKLQVRVEYKKTKKQSVIDDLLDAVAYVKTM